jgi:hypothetical protein
MFRLFVGMFCSYDWLRATKVQAISFRDLRYPGLEIMYGPSWKKSLENWGVGERSCEVYNSVWVC